MKRLFLFIAFGCLIWAFSCNQGPTVRSDHQSESVEELSDSIITLDSIIMINVAKNVQLARKHAWKAFSFASHSGKQIDLIKANILLGHVFMNLERDSSFYFYNEALTLADSLHHQEFIPDILYSLAILYQIAQGNSIFNVKQRG